MALSDYDILAFDHEGEPCTGELRGFRGASIEIYKNWAYVCDPQMWCADRGYVEPTIAGVNSGRLHISEFEIIAERGPQDAIFILTMCLESISSNRTWMAGIGCSGYSDPLPAIMKAARVNPKQWDDVWYGSRWSPEGRYFSLRCSKGNQFKEYTIPYDEKLEAKWIGVTSETLAGFFKWLEREIAKWGGISNYPNPEWLAKCRANGGLRFNQGDMFFAVRGVSPLFATSPGQSAAPIAMQLIKGMQSKPLPSASKPKRRHRRKRIAKKLGHTS